MTRFAEAKEVYGQIGVDADKAIDTLKKVRVSMHCWQGDDVLGFDSTELTGGISATGNYPGRATNPDQLMSDIKEALSLIPGQHKLNLHASYAITDEKVTAIKWNQSILKHGSILPRKIIWDLILTRHYFHIQKQQII